MTLLSLKEFSQTALPEVKFGMEFELLSPYGGTKKTMVTLRNDLKKQVPQIGKWRTVNDHSIDFDTKEIKQNTKNILDIYKKRYGITFELKNIFDKQSIKNFADAISEIYYSYHNGNKPNKHEENRIKNIYSYLINRIELCEIYVDDDEQNMITLNTLVKDAGKNKSGKISDAVAEAIEYNMVYSNLYALYAYDIEKNIKKYFKYSSNFIKKCRKVYQDKKHSLLKRSTELEGVELISPAGGMVYNKRNVNDVKKIITYLNDNGFQVNESTGLHMHVSTGVKMTWFKSLIIAYHVAQGEDKFFKMFPSRRNNEYAKSIKNRMLNQNSLLQKIYVNVQWLFDPKKEHVKKFFNKIVMYIGDMVHFYKFTRTNRMLYDMGDKYVGLNFSEHNTLEFRYGAGTLDLDMVERYIDLCMNFVNTLDNTNIKYKDMIIEEDSPNKQYIIRYKNHKPLNISI